MDEGYNDLEPSFSTGAALVGNVNDINDLYQKYLGNTDKARDDNHHHRPTSPIPRVTQYNRRDLMHWQGEEVEEWAGEVLRQLGFDGYGVDLSFLQTLSGSQLLRLSHQDLCGLVGQQCGNIIHQQLQVLSACEGGTSPTAAVGDSGDWTHTGPADNYSIWEASASFQGSYDWTDSQSYYNVDDTGSSASCHTTVGWAEDSSFNKPHVYAPPGSLQCPSHREPESFHTSIDWRYSTSMHSSNNLRCEPYHNLHDQTSRSFRSAEDCIPSTSFDNTRDWTAPEPFQASHGTKQPRDEVETVGKITPPTMCRRKPVGEYDPLVGHLGSLGLQEQQGSTSDEEGEARRTASSEAGGEVALPYPDVLRKIPSKTRKRVRGPKSWEFLVRLLADQRSNPSLVRWEDEASATFRLMQPGIIAQMWAKRSSDKPHLSYNNFARGLRYHYSTGALEPVSERQLVYRCGPSALQYLKELKEQS